MSSLPVIKHLKVFKNSLSCFRSCFKCLPFNTLLLECSKERLHQSVIITITFSAHAYFYCVLFQQGLVPLTRVLTSPIRMMQQTSSWPSPFQRHQCCIYYQLLISL